MKNLFIINEDEKKRILNLHESATKRLYLSEQIPTPSKAILNALPNPFSTAKDNTNVVKPVVSANNSLTYNQLVNQGGAFAPKDALKPATEDKTEVKSEVKSEVKKDMGQKTQKNPMVTQIQNKLIELGYKNYLGSTGADGVLGTNTLKGILTALGTSENLNTDMVAKEITSVTDQSSQGQPAAQGQPATTTTTTTVAPSTTNSPEVPKTPETPAAETPKQTLTQQKAAPNADIDNEI
jgi:hypothetical protein